MPTEWVSDGEREDFLSRSERLIGRHREKLYRIVPVPHSVSCRLLCSCQMYAIIWQLSDLFKCDKKKILYVSSHALWKKEKEKNPGFSPFSSSYLCAHRCPSLIHLLWRGESKTDRKPPLSEHQHKYKYKYRTFEMPKDSSSPWRQSPSNHYSSKPFSSPVSLPLPRLSLLTPLSLCQFAFLSRVPPFYPLQIVTVPASQAHSHLMWSCVIGWRHRFSPSPEALLYTCYNQDHPCLCQDFCAFGVCLVLVNCLVIKPQLPDDH